MITHSEAKPSIPAMMLLRSFIDVKPIASSVTDAQWITRESSFGRIETLNPVLHGKLSGQICEYFAQQQLLSSFSKNLNKTLSTFAGNIVRNTGNEAMSLRWKQMAEGDAAAALAVNIGSQPIHIQCVENDEAFVGIATGEAVLMSLLEGLSFKLSNPTQDVCLIEGYYLCAR